jgi:ribosomal protein L5
MHRLDHYNKQFINPFLLQKKSYLKKSFLQEIKFDKIILSFSANDLASDEDVAIAGCCQFLERLSGQKPFFTTNRFAYVGSKKIFKVSLKSTLRRATMLNFVDYFFVILLPVFTRRYGLPFFKNFLDLEGEWSIFDFTMFYDFKDILGKTNLKLKIKFYLSDKKGLQNVSLYEYIQFFGIVNK